MAKKAHSWTGRICHWLVCSHCGLIWLKNDATNKVARGPCRNGDD